MSVSPRGGANIELAYQRLRRGNNAWRDAQRAKSHFQQAWHVCFSAGQLAARASSASAALAAAAGPEFYTLARLGRRAPAPTPCCAEAALG